MSRPFSLISQSGGKFSMSSIESSNVYGKPPLNRWLTFALSITVSSFKRVLLG
jgi:hypothetical protein